MRRITRDEYEQAVMLHRQHCDEPDLEGRHAAPNVTNPLGATVGRLRARADLPPWESDGLGHHCVEGEPRSTNGARCATSGQLVGLDS